MKNSINKVERLWENFRTIFIGDNFTIMIFTINPKSQISLQYHKIGLNIGL